MEGRGITRLAEIKGERKVRGKGHWEEDMGIPSCRRLKRTERGGGQCGVGMCG